MQVRRPGAMFLSTLIVLCGLCYGLARSDEPLTEFPRVPPTPPSEVGSKFHVEHGFEMVLLAAEPLTTDPVAMAYDENGLAWVVEMSDYPYTDKSKDIAFRDSEGHLPIGKVRILEDTDGDGTFDTSDIFAEDLSWPTGIALYDGGAFVCATPDIWYLKDTNGDRKADVRNKVFTGFRKFNVQATMNNLIWGLDHRIYGAGATNGGMIEAVGQPNSDPISLGRNDYRIDPRTMEFELISGGARFGNTFDDWGNRFLCSIRNPAIQVVLPRRYLARNPYLPVPSAVYDVAKTGDTLPVYRTSPPEPWRVARARRWSAEQDRSYPRSETAAEGFFTSSSGVTVYRGSAYPPEFYNNLFLGEVAGNLIHRQTLTPDGVTFIAERADQNTEFVTSEDNWFRAVNFVNAPDGTLHVLDMYRETIEHPWSIPDDIKALVDLESGRDRGRIYRLSPPGFRVPPQPRLGEASTAELVQTLENPNSWWRETAHRLLFERQDNSAVPALSQLLKGSSQPVARVHALWSLSGLNMLTEEDILVGLSDADEHVREHAVRLAEPRLQTSPKLLQAVAALATDPAIRVRFQVAFSLGEVQDPLATAGLMAIARRDASDRWVRVALLSSLVDEAGEVLLQLLHDEELTANAENLPFVRELAVVVGAQSGDGEVKGVLDALASLPPSDSSRVLQMNAMLGLGDGLKRSRKSLAALTKSNPAAAQLIESLLDDAANLAGDADLADVARVSAIELLGSADFDKAKRTLVPLLDARQPQSVQLAAARVLAGFSDESVPAVMFASWRSNTPAVRAEILELLLARTERIMSVLDAVESGLVQTSEISNSRRVLLMKHKDEAIQQRAKALLNTAASSPRKDVVARYQPALGLRGDRSRGQIVFEKNCSGCHRVGDTGHDIGPNLATIRHRTREEVLLHILDPNREVGPDFVQYAIAIDDGRVATGVIADETATSITLKRAENVSENILRSNIEDISNSGISLMPEGLEQKIDLQQMADLLELLLGEK